jgi:hypothetical protein
MTLTKDKIIEEAKEKYNVSLNPKNKLAELEAQLNILKEKNKPSKKEKKVLFFREEVLAKLLFTILFIEMNIGLLFIVKMI